MPEIQPQSPEEAFRVLQKAKRNGNDVFIVVVRRNSPSADTDITQYEFEGDITELSPKTVTIDGWGHLDNDREYTIPLKEISIIIVGDEDDEEKQ